MTDIYRFEMSIPAILKRRAQQHPDRILLQDVEGNSCTYAEFDAQTMKIANGLAALGVKAGDSVVTLLDPRLVSYPLWIGICWLRAMEVPVNPEFKGNTLIYGISDCRAKILITSNDHLPKIAAIRDELSHIETIITVDESVPADVPLSVRTLSSVTEGAPPASLKEPTLSDIYNVIYTSGTTGPSKGVVVPWGSLQSAPLQMFAGDDPASYDEVVYYSPWPTFHSSGRCGLVVVALWGGGRLVIRKRLSISEYWSDIRKFDCTHTQTLGLGDYLSVQPEKPDDGDNPLRRVFMNPVVANYRDYEKRFGVVISTGWGMTEIGLPMAGVDLPNRTTCGKVSDLYDVRIVDGEDRDVPEGEVGQLIIKPREPWLLLREYLNKPEATAKAWQGGWFHTGDALRRDADGWYYFVDRVADYMRVRGNNVSSMEVEAEIRAHPDVAECAAIGVRVSRPGQSAGAGGTARAAELEDEIKIVVQRKPDSSLSERELLEFLIPRMPRYMVPRFIEFVSDFPRTPTGKIRKKSLREIRMGDNVWDREDHGIVVPR